MIPQCCMQPMLLTWSQGLPMKGEVHWYDTNSQVKYNAAHWALQAWNYKWPACSQDCAKRVVPLRLNNRARTIHVNDPCEWSMFFLGCNVSCGVVNSIMALYTHHGFQIIESHLDLAWQTCFACQRDLLCADISHCKGSFSYETPIWWSATGIEPRPGSWLPPCACHESMMDYAITDQTIL